MTPPTGTPDFARLVQEFFCDRLIRQQNVSAHTVAAYRDTFRLLLRFLQRRRKEPAAVAVADLDAPTVLAFLDDLERGRGNAVRTRNARLAAVRAFVRYAAVRDPAALPVARRVLAIPMKRYDRPLLGHLTRAEVTAVVQAPDPATWSGRRDRALLAVMYNTGVRVSEAVGMCRSDVSGDPARAVRVRGKGRKERQVPLWKETAAVLGRWQAEIAAAPGTPLFPNRHGRAMTRSGVEDRLRRAVAAAAAACPSLRGKDVSPHTLRHTTAMHLLQSGVDVTVIALWLGHASTETTHQYVEADLAMKERVLANVEGLPADKGRYRPKDDLLAFLDGL